jgi:hypothetical protein
MTRPPLLFRFFLGFSLVFWMFGTAIAVIMLSMSLGGKLKGGWPINLFGAVFAIVWFGFMHALVTTMWKARHVQARINVVKFLWSDRPAGDAEAKMWWWGRGAVLGWIAVACLLLGLIILGRLGLIDVK